MLQNRENISSSNKKRDVILYSPLSSDLAKRIVGRIRKTMYHESRSRIFARFQVLLETKHSVYVATFDLRRTVYPRFYYVNAFTMYPGYKFIRAQGELRLSCTENSAGNVSRRGRGTRKQDSRSSAYENVRAI